MALRRFRLIFPAAFLGIAAFAAWSWLRPYDWRPDPAARARIEEAALRRDRSFYWLDIRLEVNDGQKHDLAHPVSLITPSGRTLEPADSILGATDLWLKFWLDEPLLDGPLLLQINGARLIVKAADGVPELADGDTRTFQSIHW